MRFVSAVNEYGFAVIIVASLAFFRPFLSSVTISLTFNRTAIGTKRYVLEPLAFTDGLVVASPGNEHRLRYHRSHQPNAHRLVVYRSRLLLLLFRLYFDFAQNIFCSPIRVLE